VIVEHAIATIAAAGSFTPNAYKSQAQMHVLNLLFFYNPVTKIKKKANAPIRVALTYFS
jgi:hypothetical protein